MYCTAGIDLARFCAALWTESGNVEPYPDFSLETGYTEHGYDEVNNLIAMTDVEGTDVFNVPQSVAYVKSVSGNVKDSMCGKRVMAGLLTLLGKDSNIIAHETDFRKLCISPNVGKSEFGFDRLDEEGQWHVRAARP